MPQRGKQVVRYFQGEILRRHGMARAEVIRDLGVIEPSLAYADVFTPGRSVSSRWPTRYGPQLLMGLQRIAQPAYRPAPKAPDPDQSLHPSRSPRDDGMADFSIRMQNRLQFSHCEAPHIPTSKPYEEILLVDLRGDLLTITERRADGGLGSRIYAQRAIDLPETSIFTILPELPSYVKDGSFFPALGTVAILAAHPGEQLRLRAVGTDTNSGQCHGWIFDAIAAGPDSDRS